MATTHYGQRFKRAAAKLPNAFGRDIAPGTTVYGRITNIGEQPKLKFGGAPGEIETDDHGQTVMQLFITVDTPAGLKNFYPTSRMEQAIGLAMDAAGAEDFEIGATLSLTYIGPDPDNEKARLFTAKYAPQAPTHGGGA